MTLQLGLFGGTEKIPRGEDPLRKARLDAARRAAERYQERKRDGLCVSCVNPAREGKFTCEKCSRYAAESKQERKRDGLCVNCDHPPREGKFTCEKCALYNAEWSQKRKRDGLCGDCDHPAREGKTLCEKCAKRGTKRVAERYQERKQKLIERDGAVCKGCGLELPGKLLTVDHVMPESRGGSDEMENLQLLCTPCNSSKRDKTMEEWKAED